MKCKFLDRSNYVENESISNRDSDSVATTFVNKSNNVISTLIHNSAFCLSTDCHHTFCLSLEFNFSFCKMVFCRHRQHKFRVKSLISIITAHKHAQRKDSTVSDIFFCFISFLLDIQKKQKEK